jgi:hypothetical protein
MSLSPVAEIPLRDYSKIYFTGELANKDGHLEMGGHFIDFKAEVLRRAKDAKSAGILDNQNVIMMPPAVKIALETRLRTLENVNQPWTSKHMIFMAGIRKSLMEENNQQLQRNTQAETVISIMHEISGRNVQTAMDIIVKPFGVNSQEALVEVMRRQQEAFFGDAYARKAQIKDKVSKVGIAYTMAHLTMLMGILSNIYDHKEDWLTTTNPDGTTDFHDQGTPPVSQQEKRHDFIVRISDSSHTLSLPFNLKKAMYRFIPIIPSSRLADHYPYNPKSYKHTNILLNLVSSFPKCLSHTSTSSAQAGKAVDGFSMRYTKKD